MEKTLMHLHTMARAMYQDREYDAALKIWIRIKEQKPGFQNVDKWILLASQHSSHSKPAQEGAGPSVYRTQRNLLAQSGQGSRNRVFQPRASHVRLKKGLRHRHIFMLLLIVFLIIILFSLRNSRSFLIQLNPRTANLECYQGNFFPYGWQKIMELEIGIEQDWMDYVENKELIRSLRKGVTVHNEEDFNDQIIEIFLNLGDESFRQMTERGQQSAIYYYKRVFDADFEHLVVDKIVKAFINLARIMIVSNDFGAAQKYLDRARDYNYPDSELFTVQKSLDAARESGRLFY
jgi:hypothetical protein